MTRRPRFLDQPYWHQRTPRADENWVDYASPLQHTDQGWRWAHWLIGALGVVVLLALLAGWLE